MLAKPAVATTLSMRFHGGPIQRCVHASRRHALPVPWNAGSRMQGAGRDVEVASVGQLEVLILRIRNQRDYLGHVVALLGLASVVGDERADAVLG
jgi:hypothetical protein